MSMLEIAPEGCKVIKETMGGHNSVISGAARDQKYIYTFSMDGKICIWEADSLTRIGEIKETVSGGIVSGITIGNYLAVSGVDLVTKLVPKKQ